MVRRFAKNGAVTPVIPAGPVKSEREQASQQSVLALVLFPGEQEFGQLGLDLFRHRRPDGLQFFFRGVRPRIPRQVDGFAKTR